MPTGDKAIRVNTREEASEVLIVDLWCRVGVEVPLFQELNEFKNITFSEVVWKSHGKELVDELGDAVQHWSKWGSKEADDWTAREKLLLLKRLRGFRQNWKLGTAWKKPRNKNALNSAFLKLKLKMTTISGL